MQLTGILTQLLTSLGTQIPLLATWVVGAILAVVFWKRDPRAALLILLACLLSLFKEIGFDIIYAVAPQMLPAGMPPGGFDIRFIFAALGFVRSCLTATVWILVFVAVFRRRPAA